MKNEDLYVQKWLPNVRTNLYVQNVKNGLKMGVFVKYLTKSVIYEKLFDGFVRTKMAIFTTKCGKIWQK